MQNYLLLMSGGGRPQNENERKSVLKDWDVWMAKLGKDLVDGGNPFTPQVKSISSDGKVSGGPIGGMASGYCIIKAESLAIAVTLAKGCPVLKTGAKITVYETFDASGM